MDILALEHAPHRGEGIQASLELGDGDISLTIKPLYEKDISLSSLELVDAIILSGGPMGVYELKNPEYEYIRQEMLYLEKAIELGKPILGICFGHQLLAHIFGAEVRRVEENKEIGWFDVDITDPNNPLFKNMGTQLKVFEFHNDQILVPPSYTKILAATELCPIQALSYENHPIYSVQFHPEIDENLGAQILEKFAENVSFEDRTPKSDITKRKEIFSNFVCMAKKQMQEGL